ncbi:MAG: iron ABC transporter permease [candidate division NC10 bacterium]|nr:iron ABC transporter permease [candidate division NC10 bacterium]
MSRAVAVQKAASPLPLLAAIREHVTFWSLVTLLGFCTVIALLIVPMVNIGIASLATAAGDFKIIENYARFFSRKYYYITLVNSLWVSGLATVGAILIGVPMAYCVSRYDVWGKSLVRAAVVLTFVSPPFIGSYSWVLLLGRGGLITGWFRELGITIPTIYGWRGIVLVFILQYFPFVFLMVSSALRSIDQALEDASRNLGASEFGAFRTVIWPILAPSVATGALLVFITSFSDFGTPMIIGERFVVLSTLIYGEFVNEFGGNPAMASTLSMFLLIVSIGALLLQRHYAAARSYGNVTVRPLEVKAQPLLKRVLATLFVLLLLSLAMLPTATIVVSSFLKTKGPLLLPEFSLESYRQVLYTLPHVLKNTLLLSTISTGLGVVAGTLVAYVIVRRRSLATTVLDSLIMFPYAVPGVVLAVGLVITFNRPPVLLTGTWVIMVLAYVIRRLPYSVRSSVGMLQQLDTGVEDASINLGVPPAQTFLRITVPLLAPAILSGALLTWSTTIRELSATVILYSGPWATMSVEIFAQVLIGSFGKASALGTVLILITFVPLLILFHYLGKGEEVLV